MSEESPSHGAYEPPPKNSAEQSQMALKHPVSRRMYCLPTPQISLAANRVLSRVSRRLSSCPFVAYPRFGKTHALKYISEELAQNCKNTFVIKLICERNESRSSRIFHNYLFETSGGVVERVRRDAASALMRLVRRWAVEAAECEADHIALLLDEFQRLTVEELTYLADLVNQAAELGLRVTTVAVGSIEMLSMRELLSALGRQDLIGRFFLGLAPFQGVSSVDDLREVMTAYDDVKIAEFPEGSGWSFSQFFFPQAFDLGWRLAKCAPLLWEQFRRVNRKRGNLEVGAEFWSSAIEYVLTTQMSFHSAVGPMETAIWREAVFESGFEDALALTQATGAITHTVKTGRSKIHGGD